MIYLLNDKERNDKYDDISLFFKCNDLNAVRGSSPSIIRILLLERSKYSNVVILPIPIVLSIKLFNKTSQIELMQLVTLLFHCHEDAALPNNKNI